MNEDTRTNEEIVTRAVMAELPILPFPLPVSAIARGVVAALAAAGRLVAPTGQVRHGFTSDSYGRVVRDDTALLNLEAVIAELRAEVAQWASAPAGEFAPVVLAAELFGRIADRAGDPVVLREHDAKVWDEGYEKAADLARRNRKATWPDDGNPYRGEGS